MNKYQYQIDLRPLTKYFFGGERYFDEDETPFYFQTSREFPQQTSVLGLLRYQILLENGLLELTDKGPKLIKNSQKDPAELIGPASFSGDDSDDFKIIQQLSPVFISDQEGHAFFVYPQAKVEAELKELEFGHWSDIKIATTNSRKTTFTPLTTFDHKKGFEYGFKDFESGAFLTRDSIFLEQIKKEEQIGVYKAYRKDGVVKQTENEGFYKYQYYQLDAQYCFSAYLTTTGPLNIAQQIVRFGKERSPFELTVTEKKNPLVREEIQSGSEILLLSDAKLDYNWSDYCQYAITKSLSFKNLQFNLKKPDNNYSDRPKFSDRINLLRKGSVLVVSDDKNHASELQELFNKPKAFLKIGYNHYKILK